MFNPPKTLPPHSINIPDRYYGDTFINLLKKVESSKSRLELIKLFTIDAIFKDLDQFESDIFPHLFIWKYGKDHEFSAILYKLFREGYNLDENDCIFIQNADHEFIFSADFNMSAFIYYYENHSKMNKNDLDDLKEHIRIILHKNEDRQGLYVLFRVYEADKKILQYYIDNWDSFKKFKL